MRPLTFEVDKWSTLTCVQHSEGNGCINCLAKFGRFGPNTNSPIRKYLLLRFDLTCRCWGKLLGGFNILLASFSAAKELVHLLEEIGPPQLRSMYLFISHAKVNMVFWEGNMICRVTEIPAVVCATASAVICSRQGTILLSAEAKEMLSTKRTVHLFTL